jgi:hypothetical protein
MTRRGVIAGFGALILVVPAVARTQPPAELTPNAALVVRADSITVGDYCRAAQATVASRTVLDALAEDSGSARVHAATICDPFLSSFSLRALFADARTQVPGLAPPRVPFAAVARVHTGGSTVSRAAIADAMSEFRALVRTAEVRPAIAASVGTEVASQLVRATETAQGLLTLAALNRSLGRIARYERKLGPTSPRLNGPEVVLNYAAQRWIPGFRATELGGPSHLEIVASYTPAYVPFDADKITAVSASEFGVRYYLFGESFGATGWRGVLRPSYWSAGAITVSDRDGALVWPWDGRTRTGAFVAWGAIKVAYVQGREGAEWLASKQFQAVRFVF